MSLQEINVHAGHKILMEFDCYNALIVGNLHGILGQQLRPHPIHLLNTILIINYLSNYIIELTILLKSMKQSVVTVFYQV
jgi:hypothetical protein